MSRKFILYILQIIIVVGFGFFIFTMFRNKYARDLTASEVSSGMLADATGLSDLDISGSQDIKRYLSIDPSTCDWTLYYTGAGLMNVSELFIAKSSSSDVLETVEKGVQSRLDSQITSFTNYGTDQLQLLQSAVKFQIGDYYFYAVSENASQWEEIFLKLVQ